MDFHKLKISHVWIFKLFVLEEQRSRPTFNVSNSFLRKCVNNYYDFEMHFFLSLFLLDIVHDILGQQADCPVYKEGNIKAVEVRDAYYEGKLKCLYFISDQGWG